MSESGAESTAPHNALVILIPVYNDWPALRKLLGKVDHVLSSGRVQADVLVVDDGSTEPLEDQEGFAGPCFTAFRRVSILPLRRNLGHQRAIAIGMAYVEANVTCRAVLIMDSDGEDDPEDVPRLLEAYEREGSRKIIFAERIKRSESLAFRVGYAFYRGLHHLLTGYVVRVGNFSIVPRARLSCLVTASETWNHYAAAVFVSRQPYATIPTRRAPRLEGRSHMSLVNLVVHGLSAISVYSEIVGVRILIAWSLMIVLVVLAFAVMVAVRLATNQPIPGWVATACGMLLIVVFQATLFLFVFIFTVLAGRPGASFLPLRDYVYFVGRERVVFQR